MVANRHRHAAYHKNNDDELFKAININDLKQP